MMQRKISPSPFLRNIITTVSTSVITLICIFFTTRFFALGLGSVEFGVYSLVHRIIPVVIAFSTLAMEIALPRYLGIYYKESTVQRDYLLGATGITTFFSLLIFFLGIIFRNSLSIWIFRDGTYQSLVITMCFMAVGYSFYSLLYAYYRGLKRMSQANLWQIGVIALGPLLIAYFFASKYNVSQIIFLMGCISMFSFFPLLYSCIRRLFQRPKMIGEAIKTLFKYGRPRVVGKLAWSGIFAFGPFLASYFGSLKDAGYLFIGQSLLRIVADGGAILGLVALPWIASYFKEEKFEFISQKIENILTFIFHVGLFLTLHLYLWADLIIMVWLGKDYMATIYLTRIILLVIIPYFCYIMLNSFIDAIETKAINTRNLILSLIAGIGISFCLVLAGLRITGVAIGTSFSFFILGALTCIYLWYRYKFSLKGLWITKVLIANIFFFVLAWIVHKGLIKGSINFITLLKALSFEILLFFSYLLLLKNWKVIWIDEIKKRIMI